jgi:hypothetical protein
MAMTVTVTGDCYPSQFVGGAVTVLSVDETRLLWSQIGFFCPNDHSTVAFSANFPLGDPSGFVVTNQGQIDCVLVAP